ncbi:hypothetical protein [Paenibacillus sp. PL91]|uniref:hypothetical protein n=1 Tax=Paenibacillus sp. PL91 TaxID=2729538 RepID=UPI0016598E85|nr:hypothetical protein [Paenibacillus sp. PL91]MBC9203747.1 hypothetical protein [Paenibacillus sp. PL91]
MARTADVGRICLVFVIAAPRLDRDEAQSKDHVMKRFLRTIIVLLVSSLLILACGCVPLTENNMIEEITPIIFWSVKEGEDGKITISTLVPPLIKEKKRVLTLNVSLLNEGNKGFNLNYYNELKAGQIRLLFVDEAYAKQGLTSLINTVLTIQTFRNGCI